MHQPSCWRVGLPGPSGPSDALTGHTAFEKLVENTLEFPSHDAVAGA